MHAWLRHIVPTGIGLAVRRQLLARRVLTGTGRETDISVLDGIVEPTDICWDLGANAGSYTLALARLGAEVHAFEPVPHNHSILELVVRRAQLTNVRISRLALSDRCGAGAMRVPPEGLYGGYYLAALDAGGNEPVDEVTIDALLAEGWREPDFIKCDAEGAEGRILAGATGLNTRRPPVWLLETFDDTVFDSMLALGYSAYWLDWTTGQMRSTRTRLHHTRNFFFVPPGRTVRWPDVN
jgi:FkbM family methyltransferase